MRILEAEATGGPLLVRTRRAAGGADETSMVPSANRTPLPILWRTQSSPVPIRRAEQGGRATATSMPCRSRNSNGLRLNGLQSPFNPSEASGSNTGSGREADNPVKSRIAGETNGSPYHALGTPDHRPPAQPARAGGVRRLGDRTDRLALRSSIARGCCSCGVTGDHTGRLPRNRV